MRPTTIFIVGMMLVGLLGLVAPSHLAYATDYTFTTLDVPGASFTYAFGINDAGQIVGYYIDNGARHGFLAVSGPNPPPPVGTTAVMVLRGANTSSRCGNAYSPKTPQWP